ncbi:MAG: DUF4301 family protein [Candidatus Delongbacteria bacterium]|nr:DUF4301 family protein [Candidatus Delongbacteria bacterium]
MGSFNFTNKDITLIKEHGISMDEILSQLEKFRKGSTYSILVKPAVLGSGIFDINNYDRSELLQLFDQASENGRISKFVPASGAATRMFKDLLSYVNSDNSGRSELSEKELTSVAETMTNIQNFPFFDDLKLSIEKSGLKMDDLVNTEDCVTILDFLLFEKGLNYSKLPKALLKFHKYDNGSRTSLEEHFVEGMKYAADSSGNINLHFTVSPEHIELFESLITELKGKYRSGYKFNVTLTTQKPETDTISADKNSDPFRDRNGNIVLRPGGHGALIQNLNSLNEDIVFVKNIDNVQPEYNDLSINKKLLAGILIKLQNKIFQYIELLENYALEYLLEIEKFINDLLNIQLNEDYFMKTQDDKIAYLLSLLIRPVRVCGMVKNTGAPGGGPFYVIKNEQISLQIVESSQIDMAKEDQKNIFLSSTHFNPVDLVCGIKDKEGDSFNLLNYIDHDAYFISEKSVEGKPLKALELPGLWNGAMADWITVFVEVPLETFTPVKTVNDLLR